MQRTWTVMVLAILAGSIQVSGAEPEKRPVRFERETPTVLAVRKTKDSIVTLKIVRKNARKETVGSGVIVDERGYIVTNNHVIANAATLKVVLADKTTVDGEVAFEEPSQDLAVVKIKTDRKLKALPLGPASDIMVGERIIAIGHPYGYVNTVSEGIVSAMEREVDMPGDVKLKDLIQVTADINPGNSGGPLLNINGEWIGVVVALRDDAHGIAFAINTDTVQKVLTKRLSALKQNGIHHGLACEERLVDQDDVRTRVRVQQVSENTPAAAAGLKSGDEIVRLGDYTVTNRFDLERALWDVHGDAVPVGVIREGRAMTVSLTLKEQSARK